MEVNSTSRQKQIGGLASSFSLRRSAPNAGADERDPTGILTSASDLFPPSRPRRTVALGVVAVTVAQPSRNLTGFPDIGPRLTGGTNSAAFKERQIFAAAGPFSKTIIKKYFSLL
jgi:hypothetical protein